MAKRIGVFALVLSSLFLLALQNSARGQFSLLYQKDGAAADDHLGFFSVASAGDVDGDGISDFIVAASDADPGGLSVAGSAYLYSGATGGLLSQINGAAAGDILGHSVALTGDMNGDGRADFIVGAPSADPGGRTDAGSAYVYGLSCAAAKGDMNADGSLTASDVVLMLNCAFLGIGTCDHCFSDVNCDGVLTAADVVAELNYVFLGIPPVGCP